MIEYPIVNNMMGHLERNNDEDFGAYNLERCSICRELTYCKNIIESSEHLSAFPDIGQIVEGYVQIVTKQHSLETPEGIVELTSMGHIPLSWLPELEYFANNMKNKINKIFGPAIIFEHGEVYSTKKDGRIATVHAHMHLVPTKESILPQIVQEGLFEIRTISSLDQLHVIVESGKPYVFYEDLDNSRYLLLYSAELPSQLLRKYIANIPTIRIANAEWININNKDLSLDDCWECMIFRPADRFFSTVTKLRGE